MPTGFIFSTAITQLSDTSSTSSSKTSGETVEALSGIAKLVHDYGSEIVIISVFILLLIVFAIFMLKMVNRMLTEITDNTKKSDNLNQEIINKILDDYIEKKNQDDKETAQEEIEHKQNTLVSNSSFASMSMNDASRIVMGEVHCDRIGVYVFHNGNHTQYGFPFVRMSCINEFTMKGMNSTIRGLSHSAIPLQAFSNIIKCLIDNNEFIIGNIYDHGLVNADEQVISFISGAPIQSLFALAIKDDKGNIAGFTVVEFREAQNFSDHEFYDKVKDSLSTMNQSIRSIILNEDFRNMIAAQKNSGTNNGGQ